MIDDRPIPLESFDFDLPADRIALRPARPRDAARLLDVRREGCSDHVVLELPGLLRSGDLLVLNDTKVIPARLVGRRRADRTNFERERAPFQREETGFARRAERAPFQREETGFARPQDARIELTLHQPAGENEWRAFARPARKLKPGDRIEFATDFSAEVVEKGAEGEILLRFDCAGGTLRGALDRYGTTPLPPYIRRPEGPDDQDRSDYQTLFARAAGAVAAPTAGLHFTPELFNALEARGIRHTTLTLHVGAGTFLPVKTTDLRLHRMHGESGGITPDTAALVNDTRRAGGRIVAVGTTSLRLLESATDEAGRLQPFAGETCLFITPGYRFKLVDLLLTNFHLPRSTLFVLVCTFAGLKRMHRAYAHAIETGYRFYSYGDCCLLERQDSDLEARPV